MKWHYGFDDLLQLDWSSILPILVPLLLVGFFLKYRVKKRMK